MKKTLTILSLLFICLFQTASAQYESWYLADQTPTQCSTHVLRAWHQSTQINEGVCKVDLYYRPGTSGAWTLQQTVAASFPTNPFTDFTVTQSGQYWALVWFGWITPNGPCWYGYSTYAGGLISVTVDNIPTATYKVDGASVNTSTYLQTYACSPIQMTNMTLVGTGSSPAWKVSVTKVGSTIVATNNWVSGTLPASYDLKSLLLANYGSNIQGEYNVSLSVKNGCSGKSGTTYSGLVKVNANPTATSACFQISTNNTCSAFTSGGTTCAGATSACASSPKLSGSCSGGQWIGGYYRVLVEEFATCSSSATTIVSTGNTAIVNSGDVVCLDLNVLASTPGYFFSNPTGRNYKVSWTIGNACGETTSVRWFKDNLSGCRTRGPLDDKGKGGDLDAEASLGERSSENPLGFTVYPNPASGELNLLWDTNTEENTDIRMFDVTGREVQLRTKSKGLGEAQLDISHLGQGIYVIELNNGTRSIQRVVIE